MADVRLKFKDGTGCDLDEEQVLLVGSNPLPIAVAALALRPARGVHLVHTASIKPRVERIAALLQRNGIPILSSPCLNDPYSAPRIREALASDLGHIDWAHAGLHYTGGTKPMAAQVYAHWKRRRECPAQASYLDTGATLRFENADSPTVISLRDAPRLTLEEMIHLHTGEKAEFGDEHLDDRRIDAANKIYAFVKQNRFEAYRKRLPPIYGSKQDIYLEPVADGGADKKKRWAVSFHIADKRNFRDDAFGGWPCNDLCDDVLKIQGVTLDDTGDALHEAPRPSRKEELRDRRLKDVKWLWGTWLEVWLAGLLADAKDDDGEPLFHKVHQNVVLKRNRESFFEADVVAVRGHRAFLFSCTVDEQKDLVKQKLLEAGMRTAQIGGDHARFAIVSFHDDPERIRKELEQDGWEGYDTARSFGYGDVFEPDGLLAKIRSWVL